MSIRIAMVAGEASGDLLGSGLIAAIKSRYPDTRIEGIGGPRMIAAGCKPLAPFERLSVMGLVEVLGRLPELLKIRSQIGKYFIENPPDIFVGIDAPDFNLVLERRLKAAAIPVVHYVSPTIWAWRKYRIRKIGDSVDLMLALFPFETEIYSNYRIPAAYVGHPLAYALESPPSQSRARKELGLSEDSPVLALLPGSRESEVNHLGRDFLLAAHQLSLNIKKLQVISPAVNDKLHVLIAAQWKKYAPGLDLRVIDGHSHQVLVAADTVLLASGTAALEAALLDRPMVIAYRLAPFTYFILKMLKMIKLQFFSLPNILVGERKVPEFIQNEISPENLSDALSKLFMDDEARQLQILAFAKIRKQLKAGGNELAAKRILQLVDSRK